MHPFSNKTEWCAGSFSQHIGAALRNEERRVGYLTAEAKIMDNAANEVAEDKRLATTAMSGTSGSPMSPFELAKERSQLARDLKEIYEAIRDSGSVYLR